MIAGWRLLKEKLAEEAFNGEGARIYGGLWNHKGTAVVYISGSLSLAAIETFVHLGFETSNIKFSSIMLIIPDEVRIREVTIKSLPYDWRDEPLPASTKSIGSEWAKKMETVVLRVPSVIIPTEFNYVLNPLHPDFKKLTIGKPNTFSFDSRMWKKSKSD